MSNTDEEEIEVGLPIDDSPKKESGAYPEQSQTLEENTKSLADISGIREENISNIGDDKDFSNSDSGKVSDSDLQQCGSNLKQDHQDLKQGYQEGGDGPESIPGSENSTEAIEKIQDPSEASQENEISSKLNSLSRKLDDLQEEFSIKLKNDMHKQKLIDSLHQELQFYKNDLVKKHVQSMVMDVIKVIDDIRKLSEHYNSYSTDDIEVEKLLKIFERIPADLEDVFFYQGVKPFECERLEFDPKRQRILKRIETLDQSKDKTVAESLRPGYEWDGRVLRPEIVSVYLYKEPSGEH